MTNRVGLRKHVSRSKHRLRHHRHTAVGNLNFCPTTLRRSHTDGSRIMDSSPARWLCVERLYEYCAAIFITYYFLPRWQQENACSYTVPQCSISRCVTPVCTYGLVMYCVSQKEVSFPGTDTSGREALKINGRGYQASDPSITSFRTPIPVLLSPSMHSGLVPLWHGYGGYPDRGCPWGLPDGYNPRPG